jgi:hypothetical protein
MATKKKKDSTYEWWNDNKTLGLLEQAFKIGANDREACLHANISEEQLYYYQRKINPEFKQKKHYWRKTPILLAKNNIIQAMNKVESPVISKLGNIVSDKDGHPIMVERDEDKKIRNETSKWYLERKAKKEFSTRIETTGKDGKPLFSDNEEREKTKATIIEATKLFLKRVQDDSNNNPTLPQEDKVS